MTPVEQAIFTSAKTDRAAGYQVVAASPGVSTMDLRELAAWGPSHDALLDAGAEAASLNFHELPSGAFCVSRTVHAGWEYSGRGGHRVYTHCLIVAADVLGHFANNAFALARAAEAAGLLDVADPLPRQLAAVHLSGGAAPVDPQLLARLAATPGPQAIAAMVQAARNGCRLAVTGVPSAGALIEGLVNCLPPQCRTQFSFSTGLRFSSRRPFRVVALSDDPAGHRWVAHQPNVVVLELTERLLIDTTPMDGWARLIERVLASGRTEFLAAQLSKRRFDLACDDLPALGLQLLEDLDALEFLGAGHAEIADEDAVFPDVLPGSLPQHAHAAHHQFAKSRPVAAAAARPAAPSQSLDSATPEVLEMLERLDDAVYEAIGGHAAAMVQLRTLWPAVLAALGEELVCESREQYLRYALSIWEDCAQAGSTRDPSRAVQALEVLCVLFDEA